MRNPRVKPTCPLERRLPGARPWPLRVWAACGIVAGATACSPEAPSPAVGDNERSRGPSPTASARDVDEIELDALVPCGEVDPGRAAALVVEHARHVLLTALERSAFLDASTTLASIARGLFGGNYPHGVLNVAARKEEVEALLEDVTQRYLTSENLEHSDGSTVTYLLRPEALCPAPALDAGQAFEEEQREHQRCVDRFTVPRRLELSRVRCDAASDQLLLRFSIGDRDLHPLALLLDREALQVSVYIPDFVESLVELNDFETEVLEAVGELRIRLALNGGLKPSIHLTQLEGPARHLNTVQMNDAVHLSLSVPKRAAVDFRSEESAFRLELDPAPTAVLVEIEPKNSAASWSTQLSALALGQDLGAFIEATFDRELAEPASAVVTTTLPGIDAALDYTASDDRVRGSGLTLAGRASATAQGGSELLGFEIASLDDSAIDFAVAIGTANELEWSIPKGFALDIDYAMQPVASRVVALPEFALDDRVTIRTAAATRARLRHDEESGFWNLLRPTPGPVLKVETGALSLSSRAVPDADLQVEAGSCLQQLETHTAPHEMFGDMSAASCE